MYDTEFYLDLIREAAANTPEGMAVPDFAQRPIKPFIDKLEESSPASDSGAVHDNLMKALEKYLRNYPVSVMFKQRLWETFCVWCEEIAERLELSRYDDFGNYASKPFERDAGIALVKMLHDERGVSKENLSGEFNISERRVYDLLRKLDHDLKGKKDPEPPFRIGGQEMSVKIQCRRKGRKEYYSTPERLHPVVLQLNTMQVGHLLEALQIANEEYYDCVALDIALDLWCQLTKARKNRICEIYDKKDQKLKTFLGDIQREIEGGRVVSFQTEAELMEQLDLEGQLEGAFKGEKTVSLNLKRDGAIQKLSNVRILIAWDREEKYIAVPADEYPDQTHAVRFSAQDVKGYIGFEDEKT